MHVIALSYARGVFDERNRERARMERYAARLNSLTLIVFSRKEHGKLREFSSGKLRAIPTNSKTKFHVLLDAYRIGRKLLKEHTSSETVVITSQDPFESGVLGALLARSAGVQHQVQLHGSFFDGTAWRDESLGNRLRWFIGRIVLHHAKNIRVVSERIKRSLVRMGVREQIIVVLPVYADLDPFLKIVRKKTRAVDGAPITVLYVGRLSREKNIPLIIESVVALHSTYPNIRLRIVGSGIEHERLRLLIDARDAASYITMVPWTARIQDEMARADIGVLASNHEGYGLVLVEAAASGLPIVTTDVGCVGEVLHHEREGFVVPVGDRERYTEALATLVRDGTLRTAYGRAGRVTVTVHVYQSLEAYESQWVASLFLPVTPV